MSRYTYDEEELRQMDSEDQLQIMEEWFRSNYEDPAQHTPYVSAEGGYIWIWGGPYDASEELQSEFEGVVVDTLIEQLADELSTECWEWAPIHNENDYDEEFYDVISENENAFETFKESLENIRRLLELHVEPVLVESFKRLLFANIITVLETYLSDRFINAVLEDDKILRRFVETAPHFSKEQLHYKDIYKKMYELPDIVKKYLLDVVWHNLARVNSMYKNTLDIDFQSYLKLVGPAIPIRHDIVHRNGKQMDGTPVVLSKDDIVKLLNDVEDLVREIDCQYVQKAINNDTQG